MTTRRQPRSSYRARPARRRSDWDYVLTDPATINAGAQGAVDLMTGFKTSDRKGMTLVRAIGSLSVRPVSTGSDTEFVAALAYIQAEGSGLLPDPSTDAAFPWLWIQQSVVNTQGTEYQHLVVDVKSRRRFRDANDSIWFIIDNDDSTQNLVFRIGLRLLYLLA